VSATSHHGKKKKTALTAAVHRHLLAAEINSFSSGIVDRKHTTSPAPEPNAPHATQTPSADPSEARPGSDAREKERFVPLGEMRRHAMG